MPLKLKQLERPNPVQQPLSLGRLKAFRRHVFDFVVKNRTGLSDPRAEIVIRGIKKVFHMMAKAQIFLKPAGISITQRVIVELVFIIFLDILKIQACILKLSIFTGGVIKNRRFSA